MHIKSPFVLPGETLADQMANINLRATPIPVYSPWGKVESHEVLGPGMVQVTTADHGGIHLDDWRLSLMDPVLVVQNGWYDKESLWCFPVVAFPQEFSEEIVNKGNKVLRDTFPDIYELYYQTILSPGQSMAKDQRQFLRDHAKDYIASAAFSPSEAKEIYDKTIADDQVLICANKQLTEAGEQQGQWFIISGQRYERQKKEHGYYLVDLQNDALTRVPFDV